MNRPASSDDTSPIRILLSPHLPQAKSKWIGGSELCELGSKAFPPGLPVAAREPGYGEPDVGLEFASEETMTMSSLATWSRIASLSGSCQSSWSCALLAMESTRSADLAGLAVGDEELLHPPDGSLPTHHGLPPGMPSGIEALAGHLNFSDAHELGDRMVISSSRFSIARRSASAGAGPAR